MSMVRLGYRTPRSDAFSMQEPECHRDIESGITITASPELVRQELLPKLSITRTHDYFVTLDAAVFADEFVRVKASASPFASARLWLHTSRYFCSEPAPYGEADGKRHSANPHHALCPVSSDHWLSPAYRADHLPQLGKPLKPGVIVEVIWVTFVPSAFIV